MALPDHHVRIVTDYADTVSPWSRTMPTPCPLSLRLCWHRVCIINDYYKTWPCNQRLRWHSVIVVNDYSIPTRNLKKYLIIVFVTFCLFFTFSKWNNFPCVLDYTDAVYVKLLTMQTHVFHEYLRKNEKAWNHFCLFIWGPKSLNQKKWSKILWHCPFKGQLLNKN